MPPADQQPNNQPNQPPEAPSPQPTPPLVTTPNPPEPMPPTQQQPEPHKSSSPRRIITIILIAFVIFVAIYIAGYFLVSTMG